MKRNRAFPLLLTFFLMVMLPYATAEVFEVTAVEGELVELQLNAEDPDGDSLDLTFHEPFSEDGTWQTTWGDDGVHETYVIVSDGSDETRVDVVILVENVNRPPVIDATLPTELIIIEETESYVFTIEVSEFDSEDLTYTWSIDDEEADSITSGSTTQSFVYETTYDDQGSHIIGVTVSDPYDSVSHSWPIEVVHKNRAPTLDLAPSFEFTETDVVSLDYVAADPDEDELTVTVQAPVGDSWETGYEDAGEYEVRVTVSDGVLEVSDTTTVTILEKNREPTISVQDTIRISENDDMLVLIEAQDPDGDEVALRVEGAPQESVLIGNELTWKPSFELLKRGEEVTYTLTIFASDGKTEVSREVPLTVYDTNRAPIIHPYYEGSDTVYLNEGETLRLEPWIEDPDGDAVDVLYAGWTESAIKKTGFSDAGEYEVIITASDDQLVTTRVITIIVREVNDPPVLKEMKDVTFHEGETVRVPVRFEDQDEVTFTIEGLPGNAQLNGNTIEWDVPFDTLQKPQDYEPQRGFFAAITGFFSFGADTTGYEEEYEVKVIATDTFGSTAEQSFVLTLEDVNAPPTIRGVAPQDTTIYINKGEVVTFFIDAYDQDKDELEYVWDFGFLKKKEGESSHKRRFTKDGEREVTVRVSDGFETISYTWNVIISEFARPTKELGDDDASEAQNADPIEPARRVITLPVE